MARVARITDGRVGEVIVIPDDVSGDHAFYLASLGLDGEWVVAPDPSGVAGKAPAPGDLFDAKAGTFAAPPVIADTAAADAYARGKADGIAEQILVAQQPAPLI